MSFENEKKYGNATSVKDEVKEIVSTSHSFTFIDGVKTVTGTNIKVKSVVRDSFYYDDTIHVYMNEDETQHAHDRRCGQIADAVLLGVKLGEERAKAKVRRSMKAAL